MGKKEIGRLILIKTTSYPKVKQADPSKREWIWRHALFSKGEDYNRGEFSGSS